MINQQFFENTEANTQNIASKWKKLSDLHVVL